MPQQLLGLDIGSYSIKAALFQTTFKSFELTDLYESPPLQLENIDEAERTVVIREALLRLLQDHNIQVSNVVTAVSGSLVSARVLTLPLPNKQIDKVLPFELESHLPFNLEEILIDHHLVAGTKTQSTVLAGAIKKAAIAEHLALLKSAGIDPSYVCLDSISLFNLIQLPLAHELGTFAIVDIGHQKTSICIVSNQQVRFVRTLFTAGLAVTENIQTTLDLTWEQAQEVKHAHSILELESHSLQSKDLRRLSVAIRQAMDPLIREVIQTFQAYRAQYSQSDMPPPPVEKIFLCGGGSLVRNLPEYLHSITQMDVRLLSIFPEGHPGAEKLGAKQPALAQAVALGLRSAARGPKAENIATLNFRKSEFAFAKDLSGIKQKAIFFGGWAVVLFLMALIHQGIKYQNLSRQYSQIEKLIMKTFNEISPNENPMPKNSSAAIKILETNIAKYAGKQEILTAGLKEMTALGILKVISTRIPEEIPLDTQEISIDRNKVTLRGNTDSLSSVDRIISALKEFPEFQKIDRGDIRESADGKKSFQLVVTVGEEAEKQEKTPARKKL